MMMTDTGLGRVASGAAVAVAANVVYLVTRIVTTPYILRHVSIAEYGLWAFCFVILSYAGMSAFGINNSYIKYTAEYVASRRTERIGGLLSTGIGILGVCSLAFFAGLWLCAPLLVRMFGIGPDLADTAVFLLLGTASVFLVDLTLGAFRGVLEGLQEVAASKRIWLASTLLEVVLLVVFLAAGAGIRGVLYAYMLKTLADVAGTMVSVWRRLPALRVGPSQMNRTYCHELFVFGGKVQVLGLIGMFLGSLDRIITTSMLGLDATGLFEVGRKLPFTARSITGAASAPFLPAASATAGWWEQSPGQSLRERGWKYASLCIVTVLAGASVLAPWLWKAWHGQPGGQVRFMFVAAVWGVLCLVPGIAALRTQLALLRPGEWLEAPDLRALYLNGARYLNCINFLLYGFIIAAGPQVLLAWVGPGYEGAAGISLSVALMCVVHLATLPCSSMMRGVDRSGREFEAVLVHLVLFLLWTPAWTVSYGLTGTVWGVSLSTIVSSVHFIARTNLAFRISPATYWRMAVAPAGVPLLVGATIHGVCAMLPVLGRWQMLGVVAVLGLLYCLACGLLMRRLVFAADEWNAMLDALGHKLGMRVRWLRRG